MSKIILISFLFLNAGLSSAQTLNKISVDDAIEDVNDLITKIESVHYNPFHKVDKQNILKKKDSLFLNWNKDSISYREFTKDGMWITALMSNGHTSLDWQNPQLFPELISSSFIPFKAKLVKNKLVVTSSSSKLVKVGDTIVTINNQNAVSLFRDVMGLTGGIDTFKRAVSEKLFPLYLFFFLKEDTGYKIKTNSSEEKYITGISVQEVFEFVQSDINRENYTFEIIQDNIGLISYNKCEDYDTFCKFIDSTFQQISSKRIDKLIIDLRFNSGGNSKLNDKLLSYLTRNKYRQSSGRYWKVSEEVKQKIKNDSLWNDFLEESFLSTYVASDNQSIINAIDYSLTKNPKPAYFFKGTHCFLIGPYTYSSANYLADAIKTFKLSTLIGTATGELTNDFGEQIEFQLSNSKSYFFVPTTYDIGANKNESMMTTIIPDIISKENTLETAIKFLTKKR
jgi:hypothetical protein